MKGRISVKAIFEGLSYTCSQMPCEGPQLVLGIPTSIWEHGRRRLSPGAQFSGCHSTSKSPGDRTVARACRVQGMHC
jgi:hypothetical protein